MLEYCEKVGLLERLHPPSGSVESPFIHPFVLVSAFLKLTQSLSLSGYSISHFVSQPFDLLHSVIGDLIKIYSL